MKISDVISRKHLLLLVKALIVIGIALWLTSCSGYRDITPQQQERFFQQQERSAILQSQYRNA